MPTPSFPQVVHPIIAPHAGGVTRLFEGLTGQSLPLECQVTKNAAEQVAPFGRETVADHWP
jgi:hypothetical protein